MRKLKVSVRQPLVYKDQHDFSMFLTEEQRKWSEGERGEREAQEKRRDRRREKVYRAPTPERSLKMLGPFNSTKKYKLGCVGCILIRKKNKLQHYKFSGSLSEKHSKETSWKKPIPNTTNTIDNIKLNAIISHLCGLLLYLYRLFPLSHQSSLIPFHPPQLPHSNLPKK